MAILAALLLALGVLEQLIAIWKRQNVEGISFLFCGIDALGDLTSIVSVVFQPKLKVVGLIAYTVEFVLWLGVFACGGYFKLLPWVTCKMENITTPKTQGSSIITATRLHRTPSQETIASSQHEGSVGSAPQSLIYPNAPMNTPYARSAASTMDPADVDACNLAAKLKSMPSTLEEVTPPASSHGHSSGKTSSSSSGTVVKDFGVWHDPPKSLAWYAKLIEGRLAFGRIREPPITPTSVKKSGDNSPPAADMFPEHSTWATVAEEDTMVGLKRLTMLAKDEHKLNPKKTVDQYFSERLAKLIKDAELKFDVGTLQ
ncbi:hypothetical protein LTR62_002402 [Meristemomyces frigidus]|uniref:Uncharacterized protein n=1 Tax=Meristemomyces frigidus TaxID=1508187 RepID=A0AAN7TGT2_9PEZI|nr:hypothetical protein LTR62_002402 [Meristemomyces frigidus]